MRTLNWTYIIISLILVSGIVGYGLINYNQTKLVTQEQQVKKVVEVITPTLQPAAPATPIPTVVYKTTVQTQPTVNAVEIGKELKAMYPQYAKYSDEAIGQAYINKYGNTPPTQVHPQLPIQTNTNCSTMGNSINCTSTSQ